MKIRTYEWGAGIDNLISFKNHSTDTTYYAVKDHLNSVIAFVDESGNIAERYEYDAYGNTKVFNANGAEIGRSAIGNRYTFQGREIDWETASTTSVRVGMTPKPDNSPTRSPLLPEYDIERYRG